MFVLSKLKSSLRHSLQAMMVRFEDFSRTAQIFITSHALGCEMFSGGCFQIQWVSLLFVFWAFCNELSWNTTSVFKDQHAMKFKVPVSLPDNKWLILKGNLYFTAQNFWLEFKAG